MSSRAWVNVSKAACQASSTRLACSIVCSLQGFGACAASLLRKWVSKRGVLDFLKAASGNSVCSDTVLYPRLTSVMTSIGLIIILFLTHVVFWARFPPRPTQILTFSLYSVPQPCCTSTLVGCCSLYPPRHPEADVGLEWRIDSTAPHYGLWAWPCKVQSYVSTEYLKPYHKPHYDNVKQIAPITRAVSKTQGRILCSH